MYERRPRRVAEVMDAVSPMVGAWLWALENARGRLRDGVAGIEQLATDWAPPGGGNTIVTLLYHIALIEADYLYADVLELGEEDFPTEMQALFPYPDRDSAGLLWTAPSMPLAEHLGRLDIVRGRLLETFRGMSLEEYRRPRAMPEYDITPEWTLHHLAQHEAEHRGQILLLRSSAEAHLVEVVETGGSV